MGKKINPRRRPCSQADVKRAKKEGEQNSLDIATAIILSALFDGGFLTEDQMRPAWDAINYKSDSIVKGYCKPQDLIKTLREEYEIYI